MEIVDIVLTAVNVVLTILTAVGTYRSIRYYRKSRWLNYYAKLNRALAETEKMLRVLPKLLDVSSKMHYRRKGINYSIAIGDVGKELDASLNVISSELPLEYVSQFKSLLDKEGFHLRTYINSIITGDVIHDDKGLNMEDYHCCQSMILDIQVFLKMVIEDAEEKMK